MRLLLLCLLIAVCFATVAFADTRESDWLQMEALLEMNEQLNSTYGIADDPWAYSEKLNRFIKEWESFSPAFFERYGKNADAIKKSFSGISQPDKSSFSINNLSAQSAGIDIQSRKSSIVEQVVDNAEQLTLRIQQSLQHSPDKIDFRLKLANRAAVLYEMAESLEQGSSSGELQKLKKIIAEHEKADAKAIEKATWPGHINNYSGANSASELAQAAIAFLKANPNWTKPEYPGEHVPHIAAVRGNWQVEKKIILTGEPTQYAIDMIVGFKSSQSPDRLYVYQMVFYTAEQRGIKPALPFKFANSRMYAKSQMLLKNLGAK